MKAGKSVLWLGAVVTMLATVFKEKTKVTKMRAAIIAELTEKNVPDEEVLKILKGINDRVSAEEMTGDEFIEVVVEAASNLKQSAVDKADELLATLEGVANDSREVVAKLLTDLAKKVTVKK